MSQLLQVTRPIGGADAVLFAKLVDEREGKCALVLVDASSCAFGIQDLQWIYVVFFAQIVDCCRGQSDVLIVGQYIRVYYGTIIVALFDGVRRRGGRLDDIANNVLHFLTVRRNAATRRLERSTERAPRRKFISGRPRLNHPTSQFWQLLKRPTRARSGSPPFRFQP